ncbi:hypothetical protein IP90_01167 [Luteimonas cucumeris]|uniref:AsmA protein n=1 Tax=Luteimonas cucumeris TaxID=985012 RepID=A0A562LBW2_9GAMM|nr:hypothetical protein [Luteimonas cucumeris]TWI05025.1 hypothetical protein IP90_01167 [Luteimonas cucumeris]
MAAESQPPNHWSGRKRALSAALLVSLLLALLAAYWFTRPARVSAFILDRAGAALGLEITAGGASEYRLLGTPMLVLRDVVARQPGADTPLLRAQRIHLALPWSTIRARGADLTVERIELDAPQLDVAELQRWLSSRPAGDTRIPTLTDGLRVSRGRVVGDGWSLDALDFDLPSLYPDRGVRAHVRGRFVAESVGAPFDLQVALTRPAMEAGLGLSGQVEIESRDWQLAVKPIVGARLHSGAAGFELQRMKLGAIARYRSGDTNLPFVLGIAGPLRYHDSKLQLEPLGSIVRGQGPIPTLRAHGRLSFGDALSLRLTGSMADWPESWPVLPAPIGASASPLPFALDYTGEPDFSEVVTLQLQRDETRFSGRFRLSDVTAWLDANTSASPLPPLDGHLVTPTLEVADAKLEGVEIEIDDPAVADPAVQ